MILDKTVPKMKTTWITYGWRLRIWARSETLEPEKSKPILARWDRDTAERSHCSKSSTYEIVSEFKHLWLQRLIIKFIKSLTFCFWRLQRLFRGWNPLRAWFEGEKRFLHFDVHFRVHNELFHCFNKHLRLDRCFLSHHFESFLLFENVLKFKLIVNSHDFSF